MKQVLLKVCDETILVTIADNGGVSMSSTLKEIQVDPKIARSYQAGIDGLESLVLAHARLGVDIEDSRYVEGLVNTVKYLSWSEDHRGSRYFSSIEEEAKYDRDVEVEFSDGNHITISVNDEDHVALSVSSYLCEAEPDTDQYLMIEGLEAVVTYHVLEDIDIQDPKYAEGIRMAAEAIANHD